MLDASAAAGGGHATKETASRRPAPDFQAHLADLEARGLLVRIDNPIDKDTELHPLVRWQFLGGLAEDKRRAFLFTNVTDAKGRRYDMPVAVGALAASPDIYAAGMGQPVDSIGAAWMRAIANPIPPVAVATAPCQEVVITGDDLRSPGGGLARLPVPVSTPGFDAAPYLTATLCITRDPDTGVQNMGMYRAALKATDRLAVRMVARPSGGAGGYYHWLKYNSAARANADRDRGRRRAGGGVHQPAETRHRSRRTGGRRRARWRADPHRQGEDRGPHGAGRRRDRHRGLYRSAKSSSPRRRSAKATAMWRSRPTTCRCR